MKAYAFSTALSNFEVIISHIPYSTGYSLQDWKTAINTIIEKKEKGNQVGNLRIINLIEADFNYNNKKIARDVLWCCENNKFLPREQYGSHHGHNTVIPVCNKKLLFDLAHLLQKPLTVYSNDAKSCYDRIVHSVVSLALQKMSILRALIVSMLSTIQSMNHVVRTAFGDSDSFINGKDLAKLY